jgi:hypothetical protein
MSDLRVWSLIHLECTVWMESSRWANWNNLVKFRSRFFLFVLVDSCCCSCQIACFIPCCDLCYDFPIKQCSIRFDLRVVLCVVNEIRLSSHILAPSRIFLSDDVRVAKKKHDRISCGAGTQLFLSGYLSSPSICRRVHVSWPLVFCIMFCRPLIIILSFFFAIVLSVRVMPSDYHFGILNLFT